MKNGAESRLIQQNGKQSYKQRKNVESTVHKSKIAVLTA